MKTALFVAITFVATCAAQIPDEETTAAGELTGHYWRTLSFNEKLSFVFGFQGGYLFSSPSNKAVIDASRKACLAQYVKPDGKQQGECIAKSVSTKSDEYTRWEGIDPLPGGTFKDTIESTDRFFAEPENRMIAITAAWLLSKWKKEGQPQANIDALMDTIRETYIRGPRTGCEMGYTTSAARCKALGTTLKITVK